MLCESQISIQLKQATQRSKSIFEFFIEMQPALHTSRHFPHRVQFNELISILKSESLERKPRIVPAGHTRLQYSLPYNNAMQKKKIRNMNDIIIVNNLKSKPNT